MKPCWILSTPRTGSTYLCNILNNTGLFKPSFIEHYHQENYFGHFDRCPPFAKVHWTQFPQEIRPESYHPDMQYILLKRDDLLRQVVSDYCCQVTQCWQVTNESQPIVDGFGYVTLPRDEYLRIPVPFDEDRLLQMYHTFVLFQNAWDVWLTGRKHLLINYNDLVSDPHTVVARVFQLLDEPVSEEEISKAVGSCRLTAMNNPIYDEFIARLRKLI